MSETVPPDTVPRATPGPPGEPRNRTHWTRWLVGVAAVTMLAGLLFGYDQGVIAGAIGGMKSDFSLSDTMVEVITSWVTLGALFGALVAGTLADRVGRKAALLLAAGLFTVGALLEGLAPGTAVLVVGRLTVGFGVGVASVAAPLYASETAPTHLRGRFVSSYQLAITIGIFVAYLVDQALTNADHWRLMLVISAVPAVALFLATLPQADSPRWYVKAGRPERARHALARLRAADEVDAELDDIRGAIEHDALQASWAEVFSARWRQPLLIAVGLAVFQQITGINAIIYYADRIFAAAGFSTPADQAAATTWAIGGVNVLATFIAIAYVDRFGRKPLLQAGLVGMGVSLVVVGACFAVMGGHPPAAGSTSYTGVITLVGLVVFIASFAFSLGPVTWTMINEVFPGRVRGRGVSVATAANWGSAWLVSQFFLTLVDAIGEAATFWLFAAFSALAWVWIWRKVPETRGRSLEQIEDMWHTADEPAGTPPTAGVAR